MVDIQGLVYLEDISNLFGGQLVRLIEVIRRWRDVGEYP